MFFSIKIVLAAKSHRRCGPALAHFSHRPIFHILIRKGDPARFPCHCNTKSILSNFYSRYFLPPFLRSLSSSLFRWIFNRYEHFHFSVGKLMRSARKKSFFSYLKIDLFFTFSSRNTLSSSPQHRHHAFFIDFFFVFFYSNIFFRFSV